MQILRSIFNYYIFSNIHVALGVFCFVKITLLSFDIGQNTTAIFAFFGTVLGYNFIRFLNVPNHTNWMAKWFVKKRVSIRILSLISALACVYFLKDLSVNALLLLVPFFIITFLYGVFSPKILLSLRNVPGIKIFLIAFCFAGITVLFPLVQNGVGITLVVWLLFLQRIFFVLLITIPFDIRDVDFDSEKLKTIPQIFGVKKAKVLGVILGVLSLVLQWLYLDREFIEIGAFSIVVLISIVLLIFATRKQSIYYSSFWVESMPIVWFCLVLLLS